MTKNNQIISLKFSQLNITNNMLPFDTIDQQFATFVQNLTPIKFPKPPSQDKPLGINQIIWGSRLKSSDISTMFSYIRLINYLESLTHKTSFNDHEVEVLYHFLELIEKKMRFDKPPRQMTINVLAMIYHVLNYINYNEALNAKFLMIQVNARLLYCMNDSFLIITLEKLSDKSPKKFFESLQPILHLDNSFQISPEEVNVVNDLFYSNFIQIFKVNDIEIKDKVCAVLNNLIIQKRENILINALRKMIRNVEFASKLMRFFIQYKCYDYIKFWLEYLCSVDPASDIIYQVFIYLIQYENYQLPKINLLGILQKNSFLAQKLAERHFYLDDPFLWIQKTEKLKWIQMYFFSNRYSIKIFHILASNFTWHTDGIDYIYIIDLAGYIERIDSLYRNDQEILKQASALIKRNCILHEQLQARLNWLI